MDWLTVTDYNTLVREKKLNSSNSEHLILQVVVRGKEKEIFKIKWIFVFIVEKSVNMSIEIDESK